MRNNFVLLGLLVACSLSAQTMPPLAPAPAGSKPIVDPGAGTTTFTFVVAGDNRPASDSCPQPPQLTDIVKAVAAMSPAPAFALWDGDIVYGKDTKKAKKEYPGFLTAVAGIGVPLFVAPGNHEMTLKGSTPCPVPGKKHKEKPIDEPDPSGEMMKHYKKAIGAPYGMFRYGNSAFIAVNTDDTLDSSYNPGACGYNGFVGNAQLAALSAALSSLQSDATIAHIFVFMHRPLNGEKSQDDIGPQSVKQIATLYSYLQPAGGGQWATTKLSVVFASHEHLFYMYDPTGTLGQIGPFTRTDPSAAGPFFVTTGGAGAPLSKSATGTFYHYLVVNVNGNNVTVTIAPINDNSTNCSQ